ncbi:type-F conjugative transfer system pilin assembly thiol-disulfide isomerase TrbB [Yersinia ruckeri]|uniref:type-F conjugative transfer system pilin assembly thiol-disulfide isomerase TrbB n=1 Tax=Yersinia ruckeri TaxID=29486 RepID=UPI00053883FA|nr:type-F conjugative transfer system pilin assembly thiol-disulfide isomerase TrbB [Yersinia ruckeri]AUQ43907.1 type-F conjugative transfer system pilin assembly thiol-disulfide isomerase TrbB [Yersinia ruckeri]WMS07328.1 type-F conjugative transfer system pilin assembly thiol-disulfide isomerase TrbB [Yersinia ruckeri]
MKKIRTIKIISGILFFVSITVCASTWDDIAAIEAEKMQNESSKKSQLKPVNVEKPAKWFQLSDGRKVNLNNWTIVLFMQSTCSYCHKFDPILRQLSEESGLSVFAYSLDGQGDAAYPGALPVPPEVMVEYFQSGIPIATPTTFLTNINTNTAFPLLQGAADKQLVIARMDEVLKVALDGGLK